MWVFTRFEGVWTQLKKLVGTGSTPPTTQGLSTALSANGNTLAVGGPSNNSQEGAVWIFV